MRTHLRLRPFSPGITILAFLLIIGCADDQFFSETSNITSTTDLMSTTDGTAMMTTDCSSCTYVVPADKNIIDGAVLKLKPGSIIGLNANIKYGALTFRNVVGTRDNPIIIRNCGGTAYINGAGKANAIKTENSKHFRISGGNTNGVYGIRIVAGHMGMSLGDLSTNIEVDHIEIRNSGFAGIMVKTDPGCDARTWRGNFLMDDIKIHHNYISDPGGEGIYAGNSFYEGMQTPCGIKMPHEIHNISIYENVVKNTGWDAIQLGCATKGASIHNNTIENYGIANISAQNNGIQIGTGTGGLLYNNLVRKGTGNGLIVLGLGDNIIFNNIIDKPGGHGVFCDERISTGNGFIFLNNTILESGSDGIRIYADELPGNVMTNNLIAGPGSGVFIYQLNGVQAEIANNYFTTKVESLLLIDNERKSYKMKATSPVIDKGTDVSRYYSIASDYYASARLMGARSDIGAVETSLIDEAPALNRPPLANAGPDRTITVPANSIQLAGTAVDPDGYVKNHEWIQYGGAPSTIVNSKTLTPTISELKEGTYFYQLRVTDNNGVTTSDNMLVRVVASNAAPVAIAGSDQTVTLPMDQALLQGSGNDRDGRVVSYEWKQYGGPPALIFERNSSTTKVKFNTAGNYYFRLTVTDEDGATGYDNLLVRVL